MTPDLIYPEIFLKLEIRYNIISDLIKSHKQINSPKFLSNKSAGIIDKDSKTVSFSVSYHCQSPRSELLLKLKST